MIALSTDKAVNPINLYGGTKLVSDKLFTAANAYSGTDGTNTEWLEIGDIWNLLKTDLDMHQAV